MITFKGALRDAYDAKLARRLRRLTAPAGHFAGGCRLSRTCRLGGAGSLAGQGLQSALEPALVPVIVLLLFLEQPAGIERRRVAGLLRLRQLAGCIDRRLGQIAR